VDSQGQHFEATTKEKNFNEVEQLDKKIEQSLKCLQFELLSLYQAVVVFEKYFHVKRLQLA